MDRWLVTDAQDVDGAGKIGSVHFPFWLRVPVICGELGDEKIR